MNSSGYYVAAIAKLFRDGRSLSPDLSAVPHKPNLPPVAPVALIFSPHPDDECIVGGLPLRLLRESKMRVINVAVTLGSNPKRKAGRLWELTRACEFLGFNLELAVPGGLEEINPLARVQKTKVWNKSVQVIAAILNQHQPRVIFFPHEADHHPVHVGTHWLVMDALKTLPKKFKCALVETEFWGQMASPNLLVESSVQDVSDLVSALSLHAGEVRRNPYHLRLPAWMLDNVRRGAELTGKPGDAAPDFVFATIYRKRMWKNRRVTESLGGSRKISASEVPGKLFRQIA